MTLQIDRIIYINVTCEEWWPGSNDSGQCCGIEQVNQANQAITHMDEVTQQNAALVEQAAAAAQSLQDQSANLAQVVGVFRLAGPTSMPQALPS